MNKICLEQLAHGKHCKSVSSYFLKVVCFVHPPELGTLEEPHN